MQTHNARNAVASRWNENGRFNAPETVAHNGLVAWLITSIYIYSWLCTIQNVILTRLLISVDKYTRFCVESCSIESSPRFVSRLVIRSQNWQLINCWGNFWIMLRLIECWICFLSQKNLLHKIRVLRDQKHLPRCFEPGVQPDTRTVSWF